MCWKCKILHLLFGKIKNKKHYWKYTNWFVFLHNGKDWCNNEKKIVWEDETR